MLFSVVVDFVFVFPRLTTHLVFDLRLFPHIFQVQRASSSGVENAMTERLPGRSSAKVCSQRWWCVFVCAKWFLVSWLFFVHFLSHGIDHQVVGDGAAWCEEKVKIKYVHSGELSRQGV